VRGEYVTICPHAVDYYLQITFTVGLYSALTIYLTLLYFAMLVEILHTCYYAVCFQSECSIHKFFISFNLILCAIVSVVSILPPVQDGESYFLALYLT